MATMRAIDIRDGKGPISNLYIHTLPRPAPQGSQALVRIRAFGLNRMDLLQREGLYPLPPQAGPIMGVEFSGTIEALGPESEHEFRVGDAVFGLAYGGAYAEFIAVSTHMLVRKPEELSWEECAAIPEVWITALQAMYLIGEWAPGKSILWHAGASSVAIAGQQLSHADGASAVYATTRSEEKCEFCVQTLGATAAFNTSDPEWAQAVLKATNGKGVDVIVDFLGPAAFAGNVSIAARDARIVNLATLTGRNLPENCPVDFTAFVRNRLRFEGSGLRSREETYQRRLRDQLVEHALPKFRDGSFRILIEKVYPWDQIQEAHRQMEANNTKGKLVCTIPQN